jgi:outer membrane protein OmpA-like peptidoglycan-associated protein
LTIASPCRKVAEQYKEADRPGNKETMYCTVCGQKIEEGVQFCTHCGKAVPQANRTVVPMAPAMKPPMAPSPVVTPWPAPPPYPPVQKRSGVPLVFIFLCALALIVVIGIGSVIYIGYRVKQKVTSVAHEVTRALPAPAPGAPKDKPPTASGDDGNLGGLLGNLGTMLGGGGEDDGDPVESISAHDPVTPCTGAPYPAQTAAKVPLLAGTIVTTAWGLLKGDVESVESVSSTGAVSLNTENNGLKWTSDEGQSKHSEAAKQITCNEDLQTASTYVTVGGGGIPTIFHGATRLRLSDKSFSEIKSQGKTAFRYLYVRDGHDSSQPAYVAGSLTRVEPQDVPYPMIVNDQRIDLPAIHVTGIMEVDGKNPFPKADRPSHAVADIYVIDDPLDPLVLMFRIKDQKWSQGKFKIEVIRINYPVAHPVNLVEKQLAEQKRAVTWGIYFDFNKDTIKPESAPVLKQIVQAMTDNPEWKLTVEGNTDNVGGDAYNLDLSKRRAAAVKEALVTQYHIAPDRLSTNGFGAAHPIDTNETLEGRARNRRVELSRE